MERAGADRHWLIWAAVLPTLIWAVVRALGIEGGWPLVPLLAYTPYVSVLALLLAALAAALRNWAATATAALAVALLATAVLPRALGGGEAVPPGAAELTVLSANIHHGTADPEELVGLVESVDPDVLAVQELNAHYAVKLRRAGIYRLLPNAVISVRRKASGGALYSRLPMREIATPKGNGVAFRMPRAVVSLENGRTVRVVDVHPYPPKKKVVKLWRTQLRSLPPAELDGPAPWVLAGDFNATLDFSELRDLLESGYRDAGEVTGDGLEPTWPAGRLLPPPVTIDHVLADERIAIADYGVEDIPGSDHRAVFARLAVPELP
jgi:endonuclease/exonuclease/phosphatase (EEP) superfamily protein YafD